MRSRAGVLVDKERIEIRELDVPEVLPPGCSLLRVEAGGMCGTDLHQYRGKTGASGLVPPYPVIIGHEPVGRLEVVSDEAAAAWGLRAGDRVAVEPTASCGRCPACAAARPQDCASRIVYSYISTREGPGLWGAYADFMVVAPGTVLHRLPEDLAIEDAVFFNPLAAAYSWLADAGLVPGDDVLLVGPGQRGLASVVAAKELGARRIIVAGREANRDKFTIARELGATHVLEDLDVVDEIRDITDGEGVHRSIDFTPAPDALLLAIGAARTSGTTMFVTRHGDMSMPTDALLRKGLTLKTTMGPGPAGYTKAVETLSRGTYDLGALHTHRFDLERLDHALQVLAGEVQGEHAIHVTITAGD